MDNGGVNFVCLQWSLANYRLWMSGEAIVIGANVEALAEAAAAHKNWEHRYDKQSFHCLHPDYRVPGSWLNVFG